MKLTNNTAKLLKILILTIGFVGLVIFFGVLTKLKPMEKQFAANEFGMQIAMGQSKVAKAGTSLAKRLYLQSYIECLRYTILCYEKELSIANLTPMERYVNYVYEIVDDYYPALDPTYICAIIQHESKFNPYALNSRTGVQGLAQINPKWHTTRANNLGVYDLFDPYGNILVCCDILNDLTSSHGFRYALNFYAGGYPYANDYRNSTSPFEKELLEIVVNENFAQYILPYRITENGGVS